MSRALQALQNLESGEGATVRTLVTVLRSLGREEWLRNLAPTPTIVKAALVPAAPPPSPPAARVAPKPPGLASSQTTFEQFGRKWTSNDLAREYRRKVKVIDHHDNAARLEKFVYPLVYAPTLPPDDPTYVGWRIG